ncbi:MAG: methionyl-tRNA formyltransferase [Chlamydiota bacterium]|nr:methionyl-tRNA formyltransferase [Chlamydiota bacterium]
MKVVFFGTPHFAAEVLEFLLENGVDVVAVVSKPDKAKGRSSKLVPTPVKEIAQKKSIPVYQPEKVSAPDFAHVLPNYDADLFVVVAYGEIIKQHILDLPKKGCINLHASLLPKYRGAAPIQHAIIDGEVETGVTIIHLVKKMDAGDMLASKKVLINQDDTYGSVSDKLCSAGSEILLSTIRDIEANRDTATPQDEKLVSFAPKIELEDCEIDWNRSAYEIHNLVRGVNPAPGAWCYISFRGEAKRLKIFITSVEKDITLSPNEMLYDKKKGLLIGCGQGTLWVRELQLEGKKRMASSDLLRGVSIENFSLGTEG